MVRPSSVALLVACLGAFYLTVRRARRERLDPDIVHGLARVHGGEVRIGDSDSGGARLEIRWPSDDRR